MIMKYDPLVVISLYCYWGFNKQCTSIHERFAWVKMVVKHKVEGYENFCEFMKNLKSDGEHVHVYFSGSKLPSGISWCDDCVRAHPVVEDCLSMADPKSHFVYVEVGDRSTWKDMNCPFRKDPRMKLMVIPTLLRWGNPQKLEGEQCEKPDLVEMLLTDE